MSRRPGRIIDEITIDIPDRDDPLARRQRPEGRGYVARLMDKLDIGARRGRSTPDEGAGMSGATEFRARPPRHDRERGRCWSIFLAAWEWGPGLLGIPDLHHAAAVDGVRRNSCGCGASAALP